MMAKVLISIRPFDVPDKVHQNIDTGFDGPPAPSFALCELAGETLSDMCDEFRKAVFKKAGFKDMRLY